MEKKTVIQIVLNAVEELHKEVGDDYEYNGCSHLAKIIINQINKHDE